MNINYKTFSVKNSSLSFLIIYPIFYSKNDKKSHKKILSQTILKGEDTNILSNQKIKLKSKNKEIIR